MSEWVSEAEISQKMGHKILIAGLSEAGKTAVKRIFFLKQRTEDVDKLSATINYERLSVTIKDTPITIVDLGGQKIFLKKFLTAFSPFVFSNVKIFIFLIDTANKTTRNNAFQYFKASIEKLINYSPEAEVFVFLHKNDLVRNSPNYESVHTQLKESFQLEYSEPLRFFRTSIFTPETVIDAFGRIFELATPTIAQSDFVDGRTIGEIEEFQREGMTLRKAKPKAKVSTASKIQITAPKMAGDPAVLQKLQSLMQQATQSAGEEGAPVQPKISTTPAASTPTPVKTTSTVKPEPIMEPVITPTEVSPIPIDTQELQVDHAEPATPITESENGLVAPTEIVEAETPADANEVVNQIVYLVDFCGIEPDEATEVVKSGYGELFKIAASSGIPVTLLTEFFLKYIPFVRTSQGEKKFKNLTGQRLLDIFSAHLKNELDEEMIIKCLVFAVERPKLAIDEIVSKYLEPEIEKKEKVKKPTVAPMEMPLQSETVDGTITLPGARGISFKVEAIEESSNVQISLYLQQGASGKKGVIGTSQIPMSINQDEILYLLAYEMNLANVGYFEDGVSSMAFSARVIFESIKKLKEQPLVVATPEKDSLSETIDYIIPLEIKTNGEFVILPDTDKIGFSVEQSQKRGVLINFVQRGYPIGRVNVIESVNSAQLSGLLSQAMQLPIESEGAVDFAARMIKMIIKFLVRSKETKFPRKVDLETKKVPEDDETSDKLMHYLSLLESD